MMILNENLEKFLFFVSFDEDHKKVIGILLKAMALFKLSMNENKTQNDAK